MRLINKYNTGNKIIQTGDTLTPEDQEVVDWYKSYWQSAGFKDKAKKSGVSWGNWFEPEPDFKIVYDPHPEYTYPNAAGFFRRTKGGPEIHIGPHAGKRGVAEEMAHMIDPGIYNKGSYLQYTTQSLPYIGQMYNKGQLSESLYNYMTDTREVYGKIGSLRYFADKYLNIDFRLPNSKITPEQVVELNRKMIKDGMFLPLFQMLSPEHIAYLLNNTASINTKNSNNV